MGKNMKRIETLQKTWYCKIHQVMSLDAIRGPKWQAHKASLWPQQATIEITCHHCSLLPLVTGSHHIQPFTISISI